MSKSMILIIEDNKLNFDYLYFTLKGHVQSILHAEDSKTAVKILNKNNPDLILMDFQLGAESGITLTKQIRAQGYKKPIIGVTANVVKSQLNQAMLVGMNEILTKPFKPSDLIKVFSNHFDTSIEPSKKVSKKAVWKLSSQWGADLKILKSVYNSDSNYAYSMLNSIREILPKELEVLNSYNDENDRPEIANQIHKILPSLKLFGRMDLYLRAIQLEKELPKRLNDIDIEKLRNWIDKIKITIQKLSEQLDLIEEEYLLDALTCNICILKAFINHSKIISNCILLILLL